MTPRSPKEAKVPRTSDVPTGWFAKISKTTDGGMTWSTIFMSDLNKDYYYFNGISCSSETHCVVVGEGEDATSGDPLVVAYTTFDGGNTWEKTLETNDYGLMGVATVGDNEVWLAGSGMNGRKVDGQFRKSTDGGKTFELAQVLLLLPSFFLFFHDTSFITLKTSSTLLIVFFLKALDDCFVLDLSFSEDGAGYASCMNGGGSSCSIAAYK